MSCNAGFNRYIVGCKLRHIHMPCGQQFVLIDTQWDVNKDLLAVDEALGSVLIDTQWDVNKQLRVVYGSNEFVLIDTQWDVNLIKSPHSTYG